MDNARKRILIHKINNLPTLPSMVAKIIESADSPKANAAMLADILSKDPSITSVILKLVNSAFYGNLRHISSIEHASVILGFQMVKTIAMGVSIYRSKRASVVGPSFDREQFWIHSIAVAACASHLAKLRGTPDTLMPDTVFLSGLLHDIGKVVFDNYFTDDYQRVARTVAAEGVWIGDAERAVIGMDHCDAGFYLARKWQFPGPVVEAIRYHHSLAKTSEQNGLLCALVHAADYCCRKVHLGSGGDGQELALDPLAVERFGIAEAMREQAMAQLEQDRETYESFVLN